MPQCPQSQPSKMRSSPLVMTQNQFTMGRSLCDGRFSGFGGLGACNMMNPSSAKFRSWHQQTTIPKRKSRKFVFFSFYPRFAYVCLIRGGFQFLYLEALSQVFPEFSDIYVISLAYVGGIEYWTPLCFLVFFGWPVACCLLTFETCGKPPPPPRPNHLRWSSKRPIQCLRGPEVHLAEFR